VWAPGYALFVAPLFVLGFDYFWASLLVDWFAVLLFFGAWYGSFQILSPFVKSYLFVFVLLYWGVAYSPFRLAPSTDILSLAFFSLAWALFSRIISQQKAEVNLGMVILFAFSSFLTCFFRFAYYPVAILLPFLLVLYAWFTDPSKTKVGIFAFLLTGFLIGAQLLYQALMADNVLFLDQYYPETQPRLYFEHLLRFDPIAVNTFMHDFILKKALTGQAFTWFNFFFTTLLVVILVAGFKKTSFWKAGFRLGRGSYGHIGLIGWFFVFGGVVSFTIIGFLSYLSLRYPIQVDGNWTFVQEARYFAPVYLILFLLICLSLFRRERPLGGWARWLGSGLLGSGVFFSLFFCAYTLSRYSLTDGEANMRSYYHYSRELPEFIRKYPILNSPVSVVFSAENFYSPVSWFLAMEGAAMVAADSLVAQKEISADHQVNLLVVVDLTKGDSLNAALQNFARLRHAQKLVTLHDAQTEIWEIKVNDAENPR
jgi:hypothetical protein